MIKRFNKQKKSLLVAIGVILSAVVIVSILEAAQVTHFFHKEPAVFLATPTRGGGSANGQKGEQQSTSNTSSQTNGTTTQPGDDKSTSNGSVFVMLTTPSGDFVSNHNPGSNGSSQNETSVCNTTPGATCQITFTTSNGDIKSLPAQVTDRGGSTYWNTWTPQDIGLTTGIWQINAIATLDGQIKTAADSIKLTVQ